MRIGYFPGCSLRGSSGEFDLSVRSVCAHLGIELHEVPDWNCCGASSAHVLDKNLAIALPARILAQAEAAGLAEVLVPCSACYNRLLTAQYEMEANPTLRVEMSGLVGAPCTGNIKIVNILQVIDRIKDTLPGKVTHPFGRTIACYYGCLLVRPPRLVDFDRAEDPQSMDRLAIMTGAKSIDWSFKTECCGASFSVTRTDLAARLCGRIVDDAVKRGAEAIVVACPMCHSNLDVRRSQINRQLGKSHSIPVLFITQLIGLAMGLGPSELGLDHHMVPVEFSFAAL